MRSQIFLIKLRHMRMSARSSSNMSVRMRRPEMMDGALSQSTGRLGASEHSEIDPTDGSVVNLVLACTPCGVCMETLYIDDLLVGKEDGIGYTITVITPLL